MKALCERAAETGFVGRCLVARPGLLVGPHDPTGRFTWWVKRISAGVFNLTGPVSAEKQRLTMGELLRSACQVLNPAARLHWVDEEFLLAQGVAPWSELPVSGADAGRYSGVGGHHSRR